MPSLSDAEKKAYITRIVEGLADNQSLLAGSGWDPSQRIRNLQNGVISVDNDENVISQLGNALKAAVDARRNDLEHNFRLANVTASLLADLLGREHQLVADLRGVNGEPADIPPA